MTTRQTKHLTLILQHLDRGTSLSTGNRLQITELWTATPSTVEMSPSPAEKMK